MSDPIIEHYTAERIPNPYPAGDLPWQVYHTVRNAVVRCCRRFGPTGPMGELPIADSDSPDSEKNWESGDDDPVDYYIIDDQYNSERYLYMELLRPEALHADWLRDLMAALGSHPGWGVGITNFEEAYALVFSDKLMVTGSAFAACHDLAALLRAGQPALVT
jgi:hypothetical protein